MGNSASSTASTVTGPTTDILPLPLTSSPGAPSIPSIVAPPVTVPGLSGGKSSDSGSNSSTPSVPNPVPSGIPVVSDLAGAVTSAPGVTLEQVKAINDALGTQLREQINNTQSGVTATLNETLNQSQNATFNFLRDTEGRLTNTFNTGLGFAETRINNTVNDIGNRTLGAIDTLGDRTLGAVSNLGDRVAQGQEAINRNVQNSINTQTANLTSQIAGLAASNASGFGQLGQLSTLAISEIGNARDDIRSTANFTGELIQSSALQTQGFLQLATTALGQQIQNSNQLLNRGFESTNKALDTVDNTLENVDKSIDGIGDVLASTNDRIDSLASVVDGNGTMVLAMLGVAGVGIILVMQNNK